MHTPGPWRVAGKASGYITYAGTDPEIGSVQIATVGAYRDKELLPFNRERWDADCALIAAAPDLYEACSKLVGAWFEDTGGAFRLSELNDALAKARAALARVSPQAPVEG